MLGSGKPSENMVLAEALNLLQRSRDQDQEVNSTNYKPSLYDNIVKGPAQEQYSDLIRTPKIENRKQKQRISDQFISNLLSGIKSSEVSDVAGALDFADLYNMNSRELSLYIKSVKSEQKLFEILETFYYNDRLTFNVLSSIVLNKALVNIDKAPIDLVNIKNNRLLKLDPLGITMFNIVLLGKYHSLHQPMTVLRNLKQNFNDVYLPLIKKHKLSAFYERIVWRYTFEFLKQFDELHYLQEINRVKSGFVILEATTKSSTPIAKYMLETYGESLTELQTIFLKIFTNPYIEQRIIKELESPGRSKTCIALQKLSVKHHMCTLSQIPKDQWSRRACYALVADLEQFIVESLEISNDKELQGLGNELKTYHMKIITSQQSEISESKEALDDFFNVLQVKEG
ncbi:uncharacterized protein SPAPADRAFT_138624 [Spathaspora passalidarum NRRL Y-27907]|uniref:Uncharacterized protein n=1 Tax=Spathaspora passalidarum (strain NRRL Y-27907 / 11-Y1) TaxID=619300 RepID=G3AMU5_SPAPN|nr:uncharacterized protein SPAPADRAFT_138624 [Spathaspora passalidarum NRRL Y-27907]EGW32359.1 hypothetical protein SPAPADRAFT_138624 [Spathaspora passalidarum NRRL Y-27907]